MRKAILAAALVTQYGTPAPAENMIGEAEPFGRNTTGLIRDAWEVWGADSDPAKDRSELCFVVAPISNPRYPDETLVVAFRGEDGTLGFGIDNPVGDKRRARPWWEIEIAGESFRLTYDSAKLGGAFYAPHRGDHTTTFLDGILRPRELATGGATLLKWRTEVSDWPPAPPIVPVVNAGGTIWRDFPEDGESAPELLPGSDAWRRGEQSAPMIEISGEIALDESWIRAVSDCPLVNQ